MDEAWIHLDAPLLSVSADHADDAEEGSAAQRGIRSSSFGLGLGLNALEWPSEPFYPNRQGVAASPEQMRSHACRGCSRCAFVTASIVFAMLVLSYLPVCADAF